MSAAGAASDGLLWGRSFLNSSQELAHGLERVLRFSGYQQDVRAYRVDLAALTNRWRPSTHLLAASYALNAFSLCRRGI